MLCECGVLGLSHHVSIVMHVEMILCEHGLM